MSDDFGVRLRGAAIRVLVAIRDGDRRATTAALDAAEGIDPQGFGLAFMSAKVISGNPFGSSKTVATEAIALPGGDPDKATALAAMIAAAGNDDVDGAGTVFFQMSADQAGRVLCDLLALGAKCIPAAATAGRTEP